MQILCKYFEYQKAHYRCNEYYDAHRGDTWIYTADCGMVRLIGYDVAKRPGRRCYHVKYRVIRVCGISDKDHASGSGIGWDVDGDGGVW